MRALFITSILSMLLTISAFAQEKNGVGIGVTEVNPDAIFQIESDNKGVLIPRLSTSQRIGIAPSSNGLMVYDTDIRALFFFNGSSWETVGSPAGTIVMWSGTTAPSGWAICNGDWYDPTNGDHDFYPTSSRTVLSPDLRNRFVVGHSGSGDYASIGSTGGANYVTLTAAQSGLPSHFHRMNHGHTVSDPGHDHMQWIQDEKTVGGGNGKTAAARELRTTRTHQTSSEPTGLTVNPLTGNTGSTGGNDASQYHENRPPYYVLAYIMKL